MEISVIQKDLEKLIARARELFLDAGINDANIQKNYILTIFFLCCLKYASSKSVISGQKKSKSPLVGDCPSYLFDIFNSIDENSSQLFQESISRFVESSSRDRETVSLNYLKYIPFDSVSLGNAETRLPLLRSLFRLFEKNLTNEETSRIFENCSQSFDFIIKTFVKDQDRRESSFYTPPEISELICKLAEPSEREEIYDPSCGVGSLLVTAGRFVKKSLDKNVCYNLYGQEINQANCALAQMNLAINGENNFKVRCSDTLRDPQFYNGNFLKKFDVVIANPPLIIQDWGVGHAQADAFNRFEFGIPPRNRGDYAFIQHMLKSLKQDTGRLITVAPHGVLFRKSTEATIRRRIIDQNLLDTVIALPDKVFHEFEISTVILVFKKQKNDRDILFVDGRNDFLEGKKRNTLKPETISAIVDVYKDRIEKNSFSYLASLDEIIKNEYNLNIPIYLSKREPEESIELSAVDETRLKVLQQAEAVEAKAKAGIDSIGNLTDIL